MTELKRCARCGLDKPVTEYRIKDRRPPSGRRSTPTVYRARICMVCDVDRRIERRERELYRSTFTRRRRDHASRWGYTVAELVGFGWDVERRSIEMEAAHRFGYCPNCIAVVDGAAVVHYFRDEPAGLREMTIDLLDPTKPPQWPGNIQWLCGTCNRRKRDASPILHGQRIQAEHELRAAEQAAEPPIAGQLSLI